MKKMLLSICFLSIVQNVFAYDFQVGQLYYNVISSSELTVEVTSQYASWHTGEQFYYYNYDGSYTGYFRSGFYVYFDSLPLFYGDSRYNRYTNYNRTMHIQCTDPYGSISIPDTIVYQGVTFSVVRIGDHAFYGCRYLSQVNIPATITLIGDSAFAGCTSLTNVVSLNTSTIGQKSFSGCTSLSYVSFGGNVFSIGSGAFVGCTLLAAFHLDGTYNPPIVGYNALNDIPTYASFYVPCASINAYHQNGSWNRFPHFYGIGAVGNLLVVSNNEIGGNTLIIDSADCSNPAVIQAVANYGYHFDHWSNGSTRNPDTIHLIGDSAIVAYFAPNQYRVVGVPNYPDRGFVLGGDTVDYLDTVLLTAMANHGYMFDHWSDGAYENPHTVVASGNRTITAYFVPAQFSLSVISSDLNMGTVSGGGNFDYQSNRTIRAIANTGYHFTQWNDGDANNNRTITLTQDTSFTAYFAPSQYTLTLQSADESLGIVTGGGEYDYLDTVTITATAIAPHYHFERWSDNNTENPRQYVITGNTSLTAYFALDVHTVVVQVDNLAHGTVSGGGNYAYGSAATITAETPFSGWVFSHWSDGATYNPYTFAVLQDTVMTAYFVREGSQNGVDSVDTMSAKIYVNNGQIVVEGAEGYPVYLYDVVGRLLATKRETAQEVLLDVPVSGAYLVKIGDAPARRIVVQR